jgi:voltage-gated potassium channel
MNDETTKEELSDGQSGDKILRIHRRRNYRRLRVTPHIPEIFRFLKQMIMETPLIKALVILAVLWLAFSWGIYMAERGVNEQIDSFGYALWWSFAAMQTQGDNSPGPVTAAGLSLGAIWSIIGTIAFFGVVVGTLYAYFMMPRRHPSREIVHALQYNLERMEKMTVDELEILRDTAVRIVNSEIKKQKNKLTET